MKPCVLTTVDTSEYSDVFNPLKSMVRLIEIPPVANLLCEEIIKADAYFSSLGVKIDRQVLDRAKKLRVIASPTTGLDHIDLEYAADKGIKVISLRDDIVFLNQITATAELAWALILSIVRRLPMASQSAESGIWGRDKFRGMQLSGKTLGIIGFGRLGRMMAEIGRGFRMHIITSDICHIESENGIEVVTMDHLLRQSDIISIHIHLNENNRGLLGSSEFKKMKPDSILINTSRGAVIDEKALLDALKNGPLRAAGLDVIDGEWRNHLDQHPLVVYARSHDNLLITPHIGGVTYESQRLAYSRIIDKLIIFFQP